MSSSAGALSGRLDGVAEPAVSADRITRTYGPTVAANDVSLSVGRGEFVALVGHNGAGKSTLLRCLGGFDSPSKGTFTVAGTQYRSLTVHAARSLGIRSVRQELSLPGSLTAIECTLLALGSHLSTWRSARRAEALIEQRYREIFETSMPSPRVPLDRWEFAQRQMLEVCLAFLDAAGGARVVILDEATSSLDSEASDALLRWIRSIAAPGGTAVLLASHRLGEFVHIVDRAVVMSEGKIVGNLSGNALTEQALIDRMGSAAQARRRSASAASPGAAPPVGAEQSPAGRRGPGGAAPGAEILPSLDDVPTASGGGGAMRLARGEIVGIGGLDGQGQAELLRSIFHRFDSHRRRRAGSAHVCALVSGDTRREGVFPHWTIGWNVSIGGRRHLSAWGMVRRHLEREAVALHLGRLDVRGHAEQNIMEMSGGNQQKVVLARALMRKPDVLLLDDPTRGIDAATKLEIYGIFERLAAEGVGIIWHSTEVGELERCDRIHVMRGGEVVGTLTSDEISRANIVQLSFGRPAGGAGHTGPR